MGAWGYSALDNDPAYDVQYRWDEWTVKSSYTANEATEQFIKYWGDSIKYGDSITNMEIIALLAIHLNSNLPIAKKLKKISIDALNRELVEEALNEWESPGKRKEALLSLLESIGGQVKAPKKPKIFKDPSLCYSNTASALSDLKKLSKKKQIDFYGGSEVPPFLKTLNRLVNSQVWEKDYSIYEQAHRERLMMLSWYLGKQLKMSEEELNKLMEKGAKWPSP
ncbi:hypothetical protein [Alteromonas genovensis]|uniref:hypothetical protein n=1 Tax=Alteromonas genovensis TaxID=471225 RepID=UPI002FE07B93